MAKKRKYNDMSEAAAGTFAAPDLRYEPPKPRRYSPPIGVIGCGSISAMHLTAYKKMGLNVVALCDIKVDRAESRRAEFFPDATVYEDYRELLKRDDIEVVDVPVHPQDREYILPDVLRARKHTLSQKPFVLDLDKGNKLIDLADKMGVTLAVNQNGRWSPHWSWTRHAIGRGLIGDVSAVHLECHWNHNWILGTHFNRVHHIVLYDFAIHWFDAVSSFMPGATAKRVFSTLTHAKNQTATPPLLGQSLIEFDSGQASLVFDGSTLLGGQENGFLLGSKGTLRYSGGSSLTGQKVELVTKRGTATPELQGSWFLEGFMGSMGELLRSIEAKAVPVNNAVDNLRGLAICFAAVVSAESGKPESVGKVRKLPLKTCMVAAE